MRKQCARQLCNEGSETNQQLPSSSGSSRPRPGCSAALMQTLNDGARPPQDPFSRPVTWVFLIEKGLPVSLSTAQIPASREGEPDGSERNPALYWIPTGQVLGPKHLRASWLPAFTVTLGLGAQYTGAHSTGQSVTSTRRKSHSHDAQEAVETACHGPNCVPQIHMSWSQPPGP